MGNAKRSDRTTTAQKSTIGIVIVHRIRTCRVLRGRNCVPRVKAVRQK